MRLDPHGPHGAQPEMRLQGQLDLDLVLWEVRLCAGDWGVSVWVLAAPSGRDCGAEWGREILEAGRGR